MRLLVTLAALAVIVVPPPAGAATGAITTIAGTGEHGGLGDGGPASAAQLSVPVAVTATGDGGYLIADQGTSSVRRVAPDGTITLVAGNGQPGFSGDHGPATAARLDAPSGVAQLADGAVVIADANNNRIRRVSPDGTITTAVGDGTAGFGGDNGPADQAQVRFPYDVAALPGGGYLIADQDNNRIRHVDADGIITTVAGSGAQGADGDDGAATSATLSHPTGVAVTGNGFLIADSGNRRVRRVADGVITTAAETIQPDFGVTRVAVLPDGGFVIADRPNSRIRRVAADGVGSIVAGGGGEGYGGDGGPAADAQVDKPIGVGVASDGDVLVADTSNARIRRVDLGDPVVAPAPPGSALPSPPTSPSPSPSVTADLFDLVRASAISVPVGSAKAPTPALAATLKTAPLSAALNDPFTQTKITSVRAAAERAAQASAAFKRRLNSLKYGLPISLPGSAEPAVYDVAAALAIQSKNGTTTRLDLPPVAVPSGPRSSSAVIPIDAKAFATMQTLKPVGAAVAIAAEKQSRDSLGQLGDTESLRLQMAMDRVSKFMTTLSNLLKEISTTSSSVVQNIKRSASTSSAAGKLRRRGATLAVRLRREGGVAARLVGPFVGAVTAHGRAVRALTPCPKHCRYPRPR